MYQSVPTMYTLEDFETIEEYRESKSTNFDSNTRKDVMAQILLVSSSNLESVKEEIESTPELAEHLEDRHKFQHNLTHTAVYTFFSIFQSLKHHSYNSAYRDIRFLVETWWILRGLNERKDEAGELWDTYRTEIKSFGEDEPLPNLDSTAVERLGRIRDSERDKLYNDHSYMRVIMNYISERAAHPIKMDGSYLEGTEKSDQQYEQLYLSLSLLFVVAKEYEKSLEDTELEAYISENIETILEQLKKAMPKEVPVFLTPYIE